MPISTFKGGIHPPYRKLSKDEKIEFAPLPDTVFLFLTQSAGAPPKRLVEQGQDVKTGQKIAEIGGFISSNLHSPITGVVREIKKMTHHIYGKPDEVLVIERTGEDEWEKMEGMDWKDLESKVIIERIKEAGIVGLGGAAFPTHVKLTPPKDKKIDTLIINGAECEPYITADDRLMIEQSERILSGLSIVMKALSVKRAFVAIEDNKPQAIARMQQAVSQMKFPGEVSVSVVPRRYPMGAEKTLIKTILGAEVPEGGLPMDVGALVHNVATLAAIHDAVVLGKPLVERVVSVTGLVKTPKNFLVRFGTPIPHCFAANGSYGCLAGIAQATIDPWGNMRPCNHAPLMCGNLLEQSLEEIWRSPAMEAWRGMIPVECTGCREFAVCRGGCRATAILRGLEKDPLIGKPVLTKPQELPGKLTLEGTQPLSRFGHKAKIVMDILDEQPHTRLIGALGG